MLSRVTRFKQTLNHLPKRDLFLYVEGFYNRQRLHSALDYRTPDQAEQQAENVA